MTEIRKCPYEKFQESSPAKSENYNSLVSMKNNLSLGNGVIPNLLANTKLFSPISPYDERPYFRKWEKVDNIYRPNSEIEIFKAGEQLDQNDLTAYLVLLRLARPNLEAVFSRYVFLKLMGLTDGVENYNWFDSFVFRIFGSRISIVRKENNSKRKLKFWGSFVVEASARDDEYGTNNLCLQLYKPVVALLEEENWSIINMEERLSLRRNQTALSVHAFLSTNKSPKNGLWLKKDYLREYWGPNYKNNGRFMDKFRTRVIKPLGDIGFIKSFDENRDAINLKWKK